MPPTLDDYKSVLRDAVNEALAGHAHQAADVTEDVSQGPIWSLDITPANNAAAKASVRHVGEDEIVLGFGHTHVYMWDEDPQELARQVRVILTAVFAGAFDEAGSTQDAFARVQTPEGVLGLGKMHLPWPWRLRRTRRHYAAYS